MLHIKLNYNVNIDLKHKFNEIIDTIIDNLIGAFFKELKNVTTSYLRHTILHGWNYTKTDSLYNSFYLKDKIINERSHHAQAIIASKHPAAAILESGGTIKPRRAKALTVPLSSASQYGFSLEVQKHLLKTGKLYRIGNKLCVNISGAKIPIAVLVKSVKIPPYKYISRVARKLNMYL